ncbi:Protein Hook 3 like protein [Verticillium longisporum]|uniref:Protein Hook 3 like protein n=1 Tax=Verticillium longisporum TaxID=100787 RepID=A0A8I2ZFK0_VERLO|nr:Protein Hook 3 like protein [Verticillium longisporum]
MTFTKGAQDALLQWANTFALDKKAETMDDFHDGVLLSQILVDLDTSYDPSEVQTEDKRWLANKKNLQSVYKGLTRLILRECPGLSRQARIADFRAIASSPDAQGICKLLALLFAVAMLGSNNERYVTRITRDITDGAALSQLQRITVEMKTDMEEALAAAGTDDAHDVAVEARDPDLALEEENASLMAQLDKKKKNLADMETRLAHLQESYDDLKDEAARVTSELEDVRSMHSGAGDQVIRNLEMKIREQDELIATQEGQLEDMRVAKERLQTEIAALKTRAARADVLEDEVNELRYRAEELGRKANMVERYKQKLEASSKMQSELDNLRYEKEEMQRDLLEYEKVLKRNRALELTNDKYAEKMQDYEVQLIELDGKRKEEYNEMIALREHLESLSAQRKADEMFIGELQEQISTGGHGSGNKSPSSPGGAGFNLDEELENAKDVAPNLSLEISRLKAENQLLRSSMGSGSENSRLRKELEEERAQRNRLQKNFNEIHEKHTVAEAQVQSLLRDMTDEKAYNELVAQQKKSELELKQHIELATELRNRIADRDRELLSARTDLSAVEKDSIEALEELKATDKLISGSLQEELEALRTDHKNATTDVQEAQKALTKALLEKDELRKDLDTVKEQGAGQDSSKYLEKIQQLRDRLKERNEQLEKAERDRHDLTRKLKASTDGGAALAQKTQSDQIIKNLQRENALIATAWYDLTSRLQSNHVVLQRRNDVPRSWLNKQRQMVNATPRNPSLIPRSSLSYHSSH